MTTAGIIGIVIGAILVLFFLIFVLPGFFIIGARDVGILTRKNFGIKLPEGHIIATKGEIGIQAGTLMPGLYWRFPILWSVHKVKVILVTPGQIGTIESVDGVSLPQGRLLGDEVECDSFQDARKFLAEGGTRGPQIGFLRPGTYRINTYAFTVQVQKATEILENKIGIVIALDGISLPAGYIVSPRPVRDGKEVSDPGFFQNGQDFIKCQGYRGPQLDTLQPGTYYINPLLFRVDPENVAEVAPGYVAVIRSNVGKELEKTLKKPVEGAEGLKGSVTAQVEQLLTTDRNVRGIWENPIAPGKYNLNTIAYTAYLVPTSAVTIDWADAGKIGTEVRGLKPGSNQNQGVLYKFDPLKVTSKDGFQLGVNIRMVIRITPDHAAFTIARFGSVENLIDQIIHPLIDSSFRNKAGEKKAIDFFQSRTDLQKEALEHARTVFSEYLVEAQNLLVAYIDIPDELLKTQTLKEIGLQQQAQYSEQAKAQEKNIEVQAKTATANKQKDVVEASLQIGIAKNLAEARKAEAEGEATFRRETSAAEGEGLARGFKAQQDALGREGTALVNIIRELAAKSIPIVPTTLVGGSSSGLGDLIGVLTAKLAKEIVAAKPTEQPK